MKIWKITCPFHGYDMHEGFVVRAETEEAAMQIVYREAGSGDWTIVQVLEEGEEEIILIDFHPG